MAEEENAEEGKAKTKQSGYTYWKRDIDDAHVLLDTRPKPIDAALATEEIPQTSSVGSSWNKAGTWEEKDMGPTARAELERILSNEAVSLFEGEGGARVYPCAAVVTGEAQGYNIRGRPRLGFEFKVHVTWKGTFDGEEVSGELDIPDLDSSDLDGFEIRASGKTGGDAAKRAATELKRGARPAIKQAAEELTKRILER